MADATIYCKTCGTDTGHMHLAGRTCICSICGESNMAKNWKQIQADVEERKKGHQAAVAKRNGMESEPTRTEPAANTRKRLSEAEVTEIWKRYVELTAGGKSRWDAWVTLSADFGVSETSIRSKVADMDETNPAPAEPIAVQTETAPAAIETNEPKGETKMAKLTDENKADILRRHGASEATSVLAADFHVSEQTIRNVLNAADKASGKIRVAGKKKGPRASKRAASVKPQGEQAGGLKAALQAMVDAAVEVKVSSMLDALDLDAKVATAVKAAFEEALK